MADIPKISVDLDKLTLGHMEDMESGKFAKLLPVFYEIVRVDGVPEEEQRDAIRALPWTAIVQITEAITQAVDSETNPVVEGKN
jgi:hypothetical protein